MDFSRLKMVSNIYIDNFLKDFKNYKGTFSSDNIPFLEENESVICNFSKTYEEGTHFILLFRKKKSLYYFDSLKIDFIPEEIQKYFLHYSSVKNISKQIQNPLSKLCGFYCILGFLSVNISVNFFIEKILPCFYKNRMSNDVVCPELINEVLPVSLLKNKMCNL